MSRWLKNVGNFLDQLDNKAADAVTAVVSSRNRDDDDDDDYGEMEYDDNGVGDYQYQSETNNEENLQALHFYQANNTGTSTTDYSIDNTGDNPSKLFEDNDIVPNQLNDNDDNNDEGWDESIDLNEDVTESPDELAPVDIIPTEMPDVVIDQSESNTKDGQQVIPDNVPPLESPDLISKPPAEETVLKDTTESQSDDMERETSTSHQNEAKIQQEMEQQQRQQQQQQHQQQRIVELEQEIKNAYMRVQQIQQEKHREVQVITKEARTLRRNLATLNEQLAAADKEVGAQRVELDNAAQRLENDQIKYKQDIQALQTKHSNEIQALNKSHQGILSSLQTQAQNQMDLLKKEISDLRLQRQKEGGDWHKELDDAIQREKEALVQCQTLQEEKDVLMAQLDTLRLQQESLGSRLESLTAIADNATIREREAEVQLDNALSLHAKQISQRQAREAELERTVSELSAMLVVERSKNNDKIRSTEGTRTPGDIASSPADLDSSTVSVHEQEVLKSQLEIERQQNASLRRELDELVHERHEETLAAQTRNVQHEKKVEELTQQLLELRATVRDVKQQEVALLQKQQTSEEIKLDAQKIQELSDELVRLRERISVSNSENAALRNRLQAALNRAVVAEAAAESASICSAESGNLNKLSINNDPEQGFSVRRRGANNRATNNRGLNEVPTIRKALRLDTLNGNGGSLSIGKSLDLLDSFLVQSGEVLRFNPFARLFFVFYLLLLHFWTFILLMFHAHGLEHVNGDFHGSGTIPFGPGALMQPPVKVTVPTGN